MPSETTRNPGDCGVGIKSQAVIVITELADGAMSIQSLGWTGKRAPDEATKMADAIVKMSRAVLEADPRARELLTPQPTEPH